MAGSNTVARTRKRNYNNMAYLFVMPFVVVFLVFSVYPVFRTLQLSFANYKGFGDIDYVGFKNYIRVLQDKYFWTALLNTIKIWSLNIVLQLGMAFLLTIVFSDIKYKIKGLGFFRAVYYLPNIIAATSVAFLFKTLLDWRYGTINQILAKFGVDQPINWLGQPFTARLSISLIQTWMWFGNSFIMLMAGVQGINKDYFEAAAIDGAGRWKRFFYITLPLLRPILLYVTITSLIGGIQMFDLPFLIGTVNGEPLGATQTAIMYLYKYGFASRPKQVGYASAIAYTLFLLILIISLIQFKVMNRKED
ncbi:MAG: sugar ABC transporter permease [Firmicutes bacterium]|nr:sugar ABC transporter permease [Bacillota bacterium]